MVARADKFQAAVDAALARDGLRRGVPIRPSGAHLPPPWDDLYAGATSRLVRRLLERLAFAGVPAPVLEHRFLPPRLFRFDIAWTSERVAVEVDGGAWIGGRHARGGGIRSDAEKYSLAAANGWRVVRTDDEWIRKGDVVRWIRDALAWRAAP